MRHGRQPAQDRAADAEAGIEGRRHALPVKGACVVAAAPQAVAGHVDARASQNWTRGGAGGRDVGLVVNGERQSLTRELLAVERNAEVCNRSGAVKWHACWQGAIDRGLGLYEWTCVQLLAIHDQLGGNDERPAKFATIVGPVKEAAAVNCHERATLHRPACGQTGRDARDIMVAKRGGVAVLLPIERDRTGRRSPTCEAAAVAVAVAITRRHGALHSRAHGGEHKCRCDVGAVVRVSRLTAAAVVCAVGEVRSGKGEQRAAIMRAGARRGQLDGWGALKEEGASAVRVLLPVERHREWLRTARRHPRRGEAENLACGGNEGCGHRACGAEAAVVLGATR